MCERYVHDSLVITRNVESQTLLRKLGIPTELGTDTAWTFEPNPPEYARKALREAGWDEKTPVLVLCPIHPFVWPVKASIAKYIARITTGAYKEANTAPFISTNPARKSTGNINTTSTASAKPPPRSASAISVFPILVAMERLDAVACRSMREFLPSAPIFTSDDYDMFELVSILRMCSYMVSSRYHGIVTCMPSLVASAGVTMDERIRNLMRERGHEHLFLTVEDPDSEPKLLQMMETLVRRRRFRPRRHRPHRRSQSQSHGPHGHDSRRRRAPARIRNFRCAPASFLGRLSAAAEPHLCDFVERYDTRKLRNVPSQDCRRIRADRTPTRPRADLLRRPCLISSKTFSLNCSATRRASSCAKFAASNSSN